MAYNNNANKSTFIKLTGQAVIDSSYSINYSSLLNPDDRISASLHDQDELVVVRKFNSSTIDDSDYTHASYPVLASEAWSAWTLPNTSNSGSTMYSINEVNKTITFKTTTASGEWDWTSDQSGRSATITLPTISSNDTIWIIRKTYSLTKLVEFTSGSRINANNLNYIIDQLLFIVQESTDMMYNLNQWNPIIGTPNGLATLDATGGMDNSFMNVSSAGGIQGTGKTTDKARLNLADDSLVISSEQVKVDTVNALTSSSTTQPLSAKQGSILKGLVDTLSSGVNYKGTIDIDNGADQAAPSASAGDTYDIIETSGTTTITLSNFNSLSVTKGDVIRYAGSSWVKIQSAPFIRQDGTSTLSGHMDISGDTFNFKFTTQATNNNTTFPATTAYVKQEIDATLLEELSDVGAYSSGTGSAVSNGQVLKRVSGSWQNIDPNDGTNGITLQNLSNVVDSPSTGEFLKWNGSSWVTAGTGASAQIATAIAGSSADGTTNDQSAVQTGMQAVGIAAGSASSTSLFGSADLLGRHFGVATAIETFTKSDVQFRHGKLNWTKANSAGEAMLKCATETNSTAQAVNTAASAGDMSIGIASNANLAEGDLIQVYSATGGGSTNADVGIRTGTVEQFELHYIDRIEGTTLHLKEPLLHDWATGAGNSLIIKKGTSTNGRQQPHDIIFEDMTFDDTLHQFLSIGNSNAFLDHDNGSTDIRLNVAAHGLTTGAKGTLDGAILDESSYWSGTGEPQWAWLNGRTFAVTEVATDTLDLSFTGHASSPSIASSQTSPANNTDGICMAMLGGSIGIHIENGYRILFKRCRFKGFALGQVKLTGCKDVKFEDCIFESLKWTGTEGNAVVLKECRDIEFKGCTFRNVSHGIAYEGGNYTAVMGLSVTACKFIGVTSGIRDISKGVMWDVAIKNTKVECVSFNPNRNYPIADEVISYPTTGMKLVGMKICVEEFTCNNHSTWDTVSPTETSASDKINDYYETGKGWSSRWTSNSHADISDVAMTGKLHPITCYGLKIVTFGAYDLITRHGSADFECLGNEAKRNACQAVTINNCNIDTWLCGIHISAENGAGVSNQYITNGVNITNNSIKSMCNVMTIYGGQVNNAGIHDCVITNNKTDLALTGTLMRFPGVRKLQGLIENSRSGNVVNCAAVSEFVEGPACPQFAHQIRVWCDRKGDYSQPTESQAVTQNNQNWQIMNNCFVNHGPNIYQYRTKDAGLVRMHQVAWDSTTTTTNRELLETTVGQFIVWGRHAGGEIHGQGKSYTDPTGDPTNHYQIIGNYNNVAISHNECLTQKYGSYITKTCVFQQHAPFVIGLPHSTNSTASNRNSSSSGNSAKWGGSLTHSTITYNTTKTKLGMPMNRDTTNGTSGTTTGWANGSELIISMYWGNTYFMDTTESVIRRNANGNCMGQQLGWSLQHTTDVSAHFARRNEFTGNWNGYNSYLGTGGYDAYQVGSDYYNPDGDAGHVFS